MTCPGMEGRSSIDDRRRYEGDERRKIEGGRRKGDFCSEHCLLQKIYTEKFEGLSNDIRDVRRRKQKGFEATENAITRLEKRHVFEMKEVRDDVDKKAPLKIMLWILGILITYLVLSTVVLWAKLSNIETTIAVVKTEVERVIKTHESEERQRRDKLYYNDYSGNNSPGNRDKRNVRDSSNK